MSQIIEDSYYLIGLHQDRFKEISVSRLTNLLYLIEAYYMCLNEKSSLYKEQFKVNMVRNLYKRN